MNDARPAATRRDVADDAVVGATDSQPIDAYPGTPRWVKIAGIIAAVVVLLVSLMHLTGVAPSAHLAPVEHGMQQP